MDYIKRNGFLLFDMHDSMDFMVSNSEFTKSDYVLFFMEMQKSNTYRHKRYTV